MCLLCSEAHAVKYKITLLVVGVKMGATSFDTILEDYVGGFGRYQILNTLVINLVTYCAFYPILYYIFTAYQPPHRCRVPLCESENQAKVYL